MAQQRNGGQDLALLKRDIIDVVASRIRSLVEGGELQLPPGYSAENALKAAWLILQEARDKNGRPVLTSCTKESIANSLLGMVVQALNPVKKQCYFVVYGNQLVCQRSYFGDMALVKRVIPDAEIGFNVVYEDDEFEFESNFGRLRITKHKQALKNMDPDKIVGAYCVIEVNGEPVHTEIMTMAQIRRSWEQSKTYKESGGNTPHHTFPEQMAIRTVVRRACKAIINSSSDDYLLLHHMHRSDTAAADAEIEAEMAEHANGDVIDVVVGEYDVSDGANDAAAQQDTPQEAPSAEINEDKPQQEQAALIGPGF